MNHLFDLYRRDRRLRVALLLVPLVALLIVLGHQSAWAQGIPNIEMPGISIDGHKLGERAQLSSFLQLSLVITMLSLAPYILVMCTAFIRVSITLSFTRQALGTQQVPPTQVVMGLALFITMFIMAPVFNKMNDNGIQPYLKGDIKQAEFVTKFMEPLRTFMLMQTRDKDLKLFVHLSATPAIEKRSDVPFYVLCPAFVLSEVKTSFEIGFLLYIPFLVIDMIVSSVLMAMGMFMLSPTTISLPFKLLLFVMIDGWHLIINGLVLSFNMPR